MSCAVINLASGLTEEMRSLHVSLFIKWMTITDLSMLIDTPTITKPSEANPTLVVPHASMHQVKMIL